MHKEISGHIEDMSPEEKEAITKKHTASDVDGDRASLEIVGFSSRFSIITPTHDPQYLDRLYDSLLEQTYGNWKWFVLLNGLFNLPEKIENDARVTVIPGAHLKGIGELKNVLCMRADGEYLVEVDHDDWLHPEALALLDQAIVENSNPEFLYSDFVNIKSDGTSDVYSSAFGWENYEFELHGAKYRANVAPPCNARSLYQIFYSPNHIRVWRKEFYEEIGGHDRTMEICDDHDLLCRTYLAGARMIHIPHPLYFYRLRGDRLNTYLVQNAEIQKKQQDVGNKYFYDLVHEESKRRGLRKIDLGGLHNSPPGYESLDIREGGDLQHNVAHGLPFEDNTIGVIRAVDFLEHIPSGADVVDLMGEIWRVLAPNGFLISSTPSTDGKGAFCDPTHVSFWNDLSFRYYCDPAFTKYVPEFKGAFQATRVWTNFPSDWHKDNNVPYVHADLMKVTREIRSDDAKQ